LHEEGRDEAVFIVEELPANGGVGDDIAVPVRESFEV
jgi:hypothetical protein